MAKGHTYATDQERESLMYDLVIVGAGPAGITASIYAARKKMDLIVISQNIGGQTIWSADIENYTGYQFITGIELGQKFREHLDQFAVEVKEGETATDVERIGDWIRIETDATTYEARVVIIASGRLPRKLNVPGEDEFRNRGVTYCATCDGPVFAGRDVAIIGGGNSALEATLQMMKIATHVYVFEATDSFRADPVMMDKARTSDNVSMFTKSKVLRISGDRLVSGIEVEVNGKPRRFDVGGILIEIGSSPASDFVKGVERNNTGEIVVNCKCETNIPAIFAAGDVTNVYAKQIVVACGEGAKAALAAFEYLSTKPKDK